MVILKTGLGVSRPNFSSEFLNDKKDADFLISTSSLLHSIMIDEK